MPDYPVQPSLGGVIYIDNKREVPISILYILIQLIINYNITSSTIIYLAYLY